MAELPADVRALLACPRCRGPLSDVGDPPAALRCPACALAYPVEDGIPVLLVERARPAAQA